MPAFNVTMNMLLVNVITIVHLLPVHSYGQRKDELAIVKKHQAECLIDEYNKEYVPCGKYSHIWTSYDPAGELYDVTDRSNGKHGLYKLGLGEVLPCEFDEISSFGKHYGFVKKNGRWALVNERYQIITDYTFDELFHTFYSTFWAKRDGQYIVADTSGKIIKALPFDKIMHNRGEHIYFKASIKNNHGYIDTSANVIIPLEYEDGAYSVENSIFPVKKNGKWGFVNMNNEVIAPLQYAHASGTYQGLALLWDNSLVVGVVNAEGKTTLSIPRYKTIEYAGEGKFMVQENELWGYIDSANLQELIKPQFTFADFFVQGTAAVKTGGYANFIDPQGKLLLPQKYEYTISWGKHRFVRLNNKYGAVNKQGNITLPIKYDNVGICGGIAVLHLGNLQGVISYDMDWIIEPKYDDIRPLSKTSILAEKSRKWFIVSKAGKELPLE